MNFWRKYLLHLLIVVVATTVGEVLKVIAGDEALWSPHLGQWAVVGIAVFGVVSSEVKEWIERLQARDPIPASNG